jgi:hypothetical protein
MRMIDKLVLNDYFVITIKYSEPEKTTGPSGCEAILPLFWGINKKTKMLSIDELCEFIFGF